MDDPHERPLLPSSAKWSGVRATLTKILGSLSDVEKFQVILFSDRVLLPLGQEGGWIDFDPKKKERKP